jgi:hypothetical protein
VGDFHRGSELAGDLSLVAEVAKLPCGPKTITAGGQLTARKGGVPKERAVDCLNKEDFAEYLANRCDRCRGKHLAARRRIPWTRTVSAKAKKASPAGHKQRSVAS